MKKKYSISGIDCANCAAKLESRMNGLPEVNSVILTFATGKLLVDADDLDKALPALRELADKMEPGTVIEDLKKAGKRTTEHSGHHHSHSGHECGCGCSHDEHGHEHEHDHSGHHHGHSGHECSCGCSHDGHEHHHEHDKSPKTGIAAIFSDEKQEFIEIGSGIVFFTAALVIEYYIRNPLIYIPAFVIAYLILGGNVLLTAGKNLFRGKVFDENFLMGIATIGAFVIGEYPEAAGVMLFYRIGELFEDIAVGRSRKQIMEAVDMRPEVVRLVKDGKSVLCDPEDVKPGDILEVRAGDRIPLDGEITKGSSRIDTSAVTGEPVPVSVNEGSHVLSGCVNVSGVIYLKVEKPLEESMASRILEAVENAAASKPQIDRFITKFAAIYTPLVVLAAVITAVVPSLITGNWNYWVYTALTFLVISCPCALVLSVPLSFFAGIGAGSKKGILFKGGVALETLAGVKAVVMDKTGTVTEGNFNVADIIPDGISREQLLAYAGCAESLSTHPIAASIMKEVNNSGIKVPEALDIKEIPGKGMEVMLNDGKILCGNRQLLESDNIKMPASTSDVYGTEVFIAFNGKYAGCIIINDTIKRDSKEAVSDMKKYGMWTAMLTGDAEENARSVADIAGINDVYARQMPEDKLNNLVKIRQEHGAVMFIGDGINDAPVLAGADVGAAMGSGADAAIEAADVVFMNSNLSAVPESIKIAKITKKIAMENVIGALAIKAIVMVLGFAGIASMWMAVFADSGVAMLCVLNAIRILFNKKTQDNSPVAIYS
ncbi:MAG TPA: heavy metal translocating P-type ATPase [Lachnospiraceae bacterium]|nr:heavy metal translocating P-type ATPase [Lachnospiraceae bacterium]